MQIIIASTNKGKLEEFELIKKLQGLDHIEFKNINDIYHGDFDVEETGSSYYENALLKAKAAAKITNKLCLADDSGIEIEALENAPGIYTSRYLKSKANGLIDVLADIGDNSNRKCKFICTLVLIDANGQELKHVRAEWHGLIANEIKGSQGFGYDPIVHPNEYPEKTVAELSEELKNTLSHRAKAVSKLFAELKT
ncbi:MAG: RdgB/HAM1 family non-canonical purine NTP pyrophosphatase [Candidatus Caenarcaniphilales bacterium]|jgi:XTP/dITP diphosphohydrolase|nr:RdgB/HAM1 family non-canonical purine NTP pyrophosphatase [Candidatus Caenarcaniphilales bacterium]